MAPSPDKHYQARILERRDLSPDLWIVRIDPGGPFEFRAGQYATLGVDHDGKRIERAYSIVSSPYEESLEFFVELVPQGDLTPDLFKLKESDTLLCRKIAKGPQAVLPAGSEPVVGVRVPGRAGAVRAGGLVVQVCGHGEPGVGRPGLEGGDRAGG